MKSLKEFIFEESNKVEHKECSGGGTFSLQGCHLDYYTECTAYPEYIDNAFELAEIYVSKDKRKQHIATQLITEFLKFAKENKKIVVVYAAPFNNQDMSEDDLIKFYNKFGFVHDNRTNDKQCLILKDN